VGDAVRAWGTRSVRSHPLQSPETVGGQTMLGVRTLQYFFIDLFTGRFQFAEFVRQAAFMAGTSVVPTLLVTIPVGVTLSIQFGVRSRLSAKRAYDTGHPAPERDPRDGTARVRGRDRVTRLLQYAVVKLT
jgi:hypothetical protein